jgi:hypothetical protein
MSISGVRVGQGFDIHRFSDDPNRPLVLGGVTFEGVRGLEGHSDADVLLHAICDAMLGALALGAASPNGGTLKDLAAEVLKISDAGLAARARLNNAGDTEQGFLNPLRQIVAIGMTTADRLLALYNGSWGGDISRVYEAESY